MVHIWYLRGTRSWLAYLLMGTLPKEELKAKQLEKVIYFAAHMVTFVDVDRRHADLGDLPAQISNNNAGASDYAKDEIIDDGGERFLIVRSAFSTADNENRYLWNVAQ